MSELENGYGPKAVDADRLAKAAERLREAEAKRDGARETLNQFEAEYQQAHEALLREATGRERESTALLSGPVGQINRGYMDSSANQVDRFTGR